MHTFIIESFLIVLYCLHLQSIFCRSGGGGEAKTTCPHFSQLFDEVRSCTVQSRLVLFVKVPLSAGVLASIFEKFPILPGLVFPS